jgi:hypothetical protein
VKVIKATTMSNGKRRMIIEVSADSKVLELHEDRHYELGGPMDDVIVGHILANATEVHWCSIEQKWRSS